MASRAFGDSKLRGKLIALYAALIAGNLLAWGWALAVFHDQPVLLGTALLAYTLGLRHAFDADHIAAIDNVTRKLMQENQQPVAAGLFFSLGHSSVVIALSLAIAATTAGLQTHLAEFKAIGVVLGTGISVFFLFAVAAANLVVLAGVYTTFRRVKRRGRFVEEDMDLLLANRGPIGRVFRRLFGLIRRSWHMYPVGVLFGLSFDTATEIALLGISATEASQGLPIWSILVFPALFTAGMSLADTLDSTLMLGAYNWALADPMRKLSYNMTITFVSVLIAVLVGVVELHGLIAGNLGPDGPFWGSIGSLVENSSILGIAFVAIFAASWAIHVAVCRAKGCGREIRCGWYPL